MLNVSHSSNVTCLLDWWYISSVSVIDDNRLCEFRVLNTLRPRQNGRHFPDDIFKCIFLNENVWISIEISLKFVSKGLVNTIPALVQIMAWRRTGDKPLSEPMMVSLPAHICVIRPQWVKQSNNKTRCNDIDVHNFILETQWHIWSI